MIRQATDLNVSQYVCFTGALSNDKVNELLSKSNVFVLPSSPEGFGITYVEAMNNGCIVIGTRGEGIDGFVKDFEGTLTEIENIKPYLFPLSSMTDEQEEEYNDLNCYELGCFPHTEEALDYLIKNYFDYRGLIEEGLALDATGLNIY